MISDIESLQRLMLEDLYIYVPNIEIELLQEFLSG